MFALSTAKLRYGSFHRGDTGGYVFDAAEAVALDPEMFTEGALGGTVTEPRALREAVKSFVSGLAGPIQKAALILPDTWLRLIFTEISELPRRTKEREEILRWKLKQLVPFSVEDLRITALPVAPFPDQEESSRLLLGFGIEILLAQFEDAFQAADVEIGCITNATFATLASLEHGVSEDDLAVLVMVQDDAYTLSYFRSGEPLIYRYKEIGGLTLAGLSGAVRRDLRMTAGFVARNFPELPLRRAFLAAPVETEEEWASWLDEELEAPPEPLAFEHFQLTRTQVGPTWSQTAPLLGAASLEVR
ncbi:MAG: hypothetical protein V3T72_04320 [Thermoanaerobaculia bacterium]